MARSSTTSVDELEVDLARGRDLGGVDIDADEADRSLVLWVGGLVVESYDGGDE